MYTKKRLRMTQAAAFFLLAALAAAAILMVRESDRAPSQGSLPAETGKQSGASTLPPPPDETVGESGSAGIAGDAPDEDVIAAILAADKKYDIDRGFIEFCAENRDISPSGDMYAACARYINANGYSDAMWEAVTGRTFSVLYDIYTGRIDSPDVTVLGDLYSTGQTTLAFTGDVNLSRDWYNMVKLRELGGEIESCFSADLLSAMRSADLLLVNNEFPISNRGAPLEGKAYTFRADPDDLSIYADLGVDIVSLANNHIYDYGPDAFIDTLSHLDAAGIPHVGAGMNEAEASAVRYYIADGLKLAICAASSAEVHRFTPVAGENSPGVMNLYETEDFCRAVSEAKANADIVIAYVHFGKENSNSLTDSQVRAAHDIVDAGADVVIGSHPHVLQPIEFYNGTPIVYSLGNFWFNTKTLDTALLTVTASVGSRPAVRFFPCIQSDGKVAFASPADAARIIETMNSWSKTADINSDNLAVERGG